MSLNILSSSCSFPLGNASASEGVGGTKALHTCFGYAAIVHEKPNGYPFLAELDSCPADQISIEAAQPRLDPAILEQLPSKTVVPGMLRFAIEASCAGEYRHPGPETG